MKNLTPFHAELFSFLESKIGEPVTAEIATPEFLVEVIKRYQRSYDHKKYARVELDWMNSFSEKEFAALGLSKYFPKIYRGLPRLYRRDDPGQSRLKANFTDLPALRDLSVDRAVFSLYDAFVPASGTKVGILSWVLTDGLGDWMATQETARILAARFPNIEIHLFVITKIKSLTCSAFPLHLMEDTNAVIDSTMDFVLQIPTYFPKSADLFSPMESVGEYGFLESSWFHPKSQARSMGLHVLEKGIFIRRHTVVTFAEIENAPLLLTLFGTELPGPLEVSTYLAKNRFHLAYLATQTGGAIYLHSLLKMFEWDEKNIDVCTPDLNWAIQWFESRQASGLNILEGSFGVKEIRIEWSGSQSRIPIAEKGKVLRLICPGIVSFTDMQKLIALSGDWVGVRGNQSLSEVISSGKPFFYDGRDHSRYLIKDLLAMAENRLSGYKRAVHAFRLMGQAFLWNLPEDLELWVDDTHFQQEEKMSWVQIATELGITLQDPDAIAGFKKFGLICSEEHSFSPFVCHLVQRALVHIRHPKLLAVELQLRNSYAKGDISFSTFVQSLKHQILLY